LAAAVSWSSKALSPEALDLLHAVAAFVGLWGATDAAALAEKDDGLIKPYLVELSDAGLIATEDGVEDTFRTPRRIADMALGSLSAEGRAEVMERHGVYFLALLARESRNADGPFPGDHLNAIDRHLPDIIAALDYTLSAVRHVPTFRDAMVLSWTFWYQHNHLQEAQRLLERGARMAKNQAPYDAARMLNLAGALATKAGDVNKARAYYKKAYSHLSGRAPDRLSAALLSNLGHLEWTEADPFKAVDTFANAVAAWRKLDDRANLAQTLSSSVPALVETGRANDAERALNEAIDLGFGTGDVLGRWAIQLGRAQIMMALGRHAEAVEFCIDAARQVRDSGDDVTLARTLLRLAEGLEAIGRPETASQALGWAMSAAQASEAGMYRTNELRAARLEGRLRKTLGGPEFESARVAGILSNLANLLYLSGKVA
jgi:tetratricopeptide (TPR) repeat protein